MRGLARVRVATVAVGLLFAGAAVADKPAQPPAMSPEEQAMMQKWQAFMTPGDPHKVLAAKVGSWTNKVTIWMAPGAPPTTTEGTSEFNTIMDGRYLTDMTTGSFQGTPFQGHGLTGYDNMKKKYTSMWIDNMGTGIMTAEGTYDAATKTFTYRGEGPDVMADKYKPVKSVEKITGPD